jgi:hypothetical protein
MMATAREDETLPKPGIAQKLKQAIAHVLQVSEKDLKNVEAGIRKEGGKVVIVVKTDISKLKSEIGHLIHHKYFWKDAIDASQNKKELIYQVPDHLTHEVTTIYDTLNSDQDDETKEKILANLSEKIFNKQANN